jgi:aryl-alcohol dehydrogenase-like predicted oxidoreductase
MSFGDPDWRHWVLGEDESKEIIEQAIDMGINFFDTANMYSAGESERVVGNILSEYDRDEQVVASKVYHPVNDHPNSDGLSRKTIEQEIGHSLDRLGMETVDLYQIHRWDYQTPIEETLRALDDLVRRGQTRHIGASSMWAHQFLQSIHTADKLNTDKFISMQNHYNLTYREEEREMIPFCQKKNISILPWSPLARGYLARPHEEFDKTERGKFIDNSRFADRIKMYHKNGGKVINERVEQIATDKGVTMAQISLAWLLHQSSVDAPIVGVESIKHLEEAVEAIDIDLSERDLEYLEEPYSPVRVTGHV